MTYFYFMEYVVKKYILDDSDWKNARRLTTPINAFLYNQEVGKFMKVTLSPDFLETWIYFNHLWESYDKKIVVKKDFQSNMEVLQARLLVSFLDSVILTIQKRKGKLRFDSKKENFCINNFSLPPVFIPWALKVQVV